MNAADKKALNASQRKALARFSADRWQSLPAGVAPASASALVSKGFLEQRVEELGVQFLRIPRPTSASR